MKMNQQLKSHRISMKYLQDQKNCSSTTKLFNSTLYKQNESSLNQTLNHHNISAVN